MSFKQELIKMKACKEAIKWVRNRTLKQAWLECPYGDWMLWLLEKMEGKEEWLDEKEIMLLGCWCARRALKYIPEKETRPLKIIEAKEKWARGEITREEMNAARYDAMHATWHTTWSVPSAVANYTANAAASYTVNAAASYTKKTATKITVWFTTRDKELLIQADHIRTQFTPPV